MQNSYQTTVNLACAMIIAAVMLHAAHAKDVASLTIPSDATVKPIHTEGGPKAELHNHIDQHMTKNLAQDGSQTDGRSLRLMRENRLTSERNDPLTKLKAWWELQTLYLS